MRTRILVVEDETRIHDVLASGLAADGVTVDSARTGEDAVRAALDSPYDLVLLDLAPPGPKGVAALVLIHSERPDVRVVVVAERVDTATKLEALELGAQDYVVKPYADDELVTRIRSLLAQPLSKSTVLRAGRLELDPTTREARVGYLRAALTDREFRLLGFLVEHPGEAVSRERLLAEVWGYGAPGSNVVDVCVRRIRRRLGPEVPIETVRGVGYRISVD